MAQNVGELSIAITGDNSSLTSAIDSSVSGLNALSLGAGVAVGALAAVGVAAVGTAVALGKIAVESVKLGMEFDSTMSEVKAITGSTNEEMLQLNETAKQLGSTTSFSAKQAAEGMTFLGMAGFDTNEIISAMPGLLDLAAASGTDLALTADIVSDALSAFGMSAEETGRFADVLAATTSSANTTVQLLGESFKFAAPIAGTLGFSIEDVSAALGIMADASIKASQAGTTMRTLMSEIGVEAGKTENKFSELGVALLDSDGEMRGLGDILTDLQKSFSNMSEAQKVSTAESLVGKNAMSGFLAVMNDTDGSLQGLTETLENSAGTASKMSNEMLDNLAGDFKLIGSAIDGLKLQISDGLTPFVRDLAGVFSDILPVVSDFIDSGLIYLQDTIAQMTPAFEDMMKVLDEELMPIFEDLADWVSENMPEIQQTFVESFEKIADIVEVSAKIVGEIWERFGDNILNITEEQWDGLGELFNSSLVLIEENLKFFLALMEGDTEQASESSKIILEEMWTAITNIFDTALATIGELLLLSLEEMATNFGESSTQMREYAIEMWNNIVEEFNTSIETLLFEIKNFDKILLDTFDKMKRESIELINDMWQDVIKTFDDALELISFNLDLVYQVFEQNFGNIGKEAFGWGENIVEGLIGGVSSMASELYNDLQSFAKENIIDPVTKMLDIHSPSRVFKEIGGFIVEGMKLGIEESGDSAIKSMEELSKTLIDKSKLTVSAITSAFSNFSTSSTSSSSGGGGGGGGGGSSSSNFTKSFYDAATGRGFGIDPTTGKLTSTTDPEVAKRLVSEQTGERMNTDTVTGAGLSNVIDAFKEIGSRFDKSSKSINKIDINIQGSDPERTAEEVVRVLNRQGVMV